VAKTVMSSTKDQNIDLQRASPLHKAIYRNDIELVKEIIRSLNAKQLHHELIHNKLSFLTTLSLALHADRTRRIVTLILRFVLHPNLLHEDQPIPSWFELFEMTERFYKHFKSKLTSKRLAQVLSGLGPYIASGELTLNELVARPKFFKAAYMLGAKYVSQRHGDSLASHVYRSTAIKRSEKCKLFEWMYNVGMYTTNPFDLRIVADFGLELMYRRQRQYSHERFIYLPMEQECDENGFNLFHYAARGRKPSVFYGAIGFCLRKLCYTESRVIDMLLKKNIHGVTPLAIGLIIYAKAYFLWFSEAICAALSTITKALQRVARTGQLELIKPVLESHVKNFKPFTYYLYSLGVTSEVVSKMLGEKFNDIFDEPMTAHASYRTTNTTVAYDPNAPPFNLDDILPELVFEIALLLSPDDMLNFFISTKSMTRLLKRSNDRFWSKYLRLHYQHLQTSTCPSLRQRVIQDVRSRQNWQSKKYEELKFPDCKFAALDENWIIFTSTNKIEQYYSEPAHHSTYFFNCHTRQKHDGIIKTKNHVSPKVILSNNNYSAGTDPVYFGENGAPHRYRIVRDRKVIDCKAIDNLLTGRPTHYSINYQRMADPLHMFISERCAIYDVDYDKIIGTMPDTETFLFNTSPNNAYLPISRQIYTFTTSANIELFDLDYNRVATLPVLGSYGVPYQVSRGEYCPVFLDLRMLRFENFFTSGSKVIVSADGQRAVFGHSTLRTLTSWNLATRRWEFVDDNLLTPCASNGRYLVGEAYQDLVVRDFCPTLRN
jgi:hypothetical protein